MSGLWSTKTQLVGLDLSACTEVGVSHGDVGWHLAVAQPEVWASFWYGSCVRRR